MGSMGQPQFVHLHVHTDFSLLDGACETSELLDEASRQKMPAVAITDHGNLFAAANFFYEASKRDVKAIIGCEVYVAKGSRHERGEKNGPPSGKQNGEDPETGGRGNNHLVLLERKRLKAITISSSWCPRDFWKVFITSRVSITTCWPNTAKD